MFLLPQGFSVVRKVCKTGQKEHTTPYREISRINEKKYATEKTSSLTSIDNFLTKKKISSSVSWQADSYLLCNNINTLRIAR